MRRTNVMERVNWQRTRDILIATICIGIIVWVAWGLLLVQFVHAVVLLLLSLAVAFLISPAVNFLEKRGIPRGIATLVMFVLVLVALGGLFYALIFSLIQQVLTFSATIVNYAIDLPTLSAKVQQFLIQQGIPPETITNVVNQIRGQATSFATSLANSVVNIAFAVTDTLINILLILVMSFYFTVDGKRIRDSLISIMPERSMPHVLLFEDALNRVVGNYIRGQLTLAAIIGVLAGLGCFFLGLRSFALIIGVLAFLFETIPMVGPALASIPAILLSLLLPDPFPRTFWIVLYFILIQMVESNILGPRIVGHAVGLHPIASLLALIIGAQLFGAFGALLATPVVAAAWVVIASFYRSIRGETADQMLSKRRTPWVIRRPPTLLPRARRIRRTSTGSLIHEPPTTTVKGNSMPMEHIDILYPAPNSNMQEPPASDGAETSPPVKANSISVEHIDLLRPIPQMQEPQEAKVGQEEETT